MSHDDSATASPGEGFLSRWLVPLCALAGLVVGLALFTAREPVYESRTIISVNNPIGTMGDEAALVLSDRVLGIVTATLGFEPDLEVEANEVANLLSLTVRSNDPDNAALAATQLAEVYTQSQTTVAVRVADPAEANPDPVAPSRILHILVGSVAGALIGAGVAAVRGVGLRMPAAPSRSAEPRHTPGPEPIRPPVESSDLARQLVDAADRRNAAPTSGRPTGGSGAGLGDRGAHGAGEAGQVRVIDLRDQAAKPPARTEAQHSVPVSSAGSTPAHDSGTIAESTSAESGTTIQTVDETESATMASNRAPDSPFSRAPHSMVSDPPSTTSRWSSPDLSDQPELADQPDQSDRPDDRRADAAPETRPSTSDAPRAAAVAPKRSSIFTDALPGHDAHDDIETRDHEPSVDGTGASGAQLDLTDPVAPAPARSPERSPEHVPTPVQSSNRDLTSAIEAALEIAEAKFESRLADADMAHEERLSAVEAHYERHVAELKRELAETRKQARTASAHIKRMTGDDQHRIGDLEAQAAALEAEITSLRDQLESERISHLRELTAEREAADQALDNARRDFREQLDANDQANRTSMANNRVELDEVLAEVRAEHQNALDRQHREYEAAMHAERDRRRTDLAKLTRRHRDEVAAIAARATENEAQLKRQTKQTLAELRASEKRLSGEVDDLREASRQYRSELAVLRKNLRDAEQKHTETEQTLRDDLALTRQSLQTERERNAALREDVVRRTAEAHQAVDRAIDDRTAQLAELEAVVNRQREHAELRVREANQAAEDRARESAKRESELHARIVRLERELAQNRQGGGTKTG